MWVLVVAHQPLPLARCRLSNVNHPLNRPFTNRYLVDGYQHCFTDQSIYFTADAQSKSDDGEKSRHKMMHEWAGGMPLGTDGTADSVATICEGKVKAKAERGEVPTGVLAKLESFLSRNDYCESDIVPKSFSPVVV